MDFVLAALPWHVIMSLNIKQKEKYTIACGLSLGVIAGACSIVRTLELRSLSSMDNYVYDTAPMLLWSSSEVCLTIICACIPTLRPLYVRITYGSRGESSDRHSYPLSSYSNLKRGSGTEKRGSSNSRLHRGSNIQTRADSDAIFQDADVVLTGCYYNRPLDPESYGAEQPRDICVTTTVSVQDGG
jgi:hypothetical protein